MDASNNFQPSKSACPYMPVYWLVYMTYIEIKDDFKWTSNDSQMDKFEVVYVLNVIKGSDQHYNIFYQKVEIKDIKIFCWHHK